MQKSLKWVGIIIGLLLLLAIFAAVCLVTFVNPNRFKPLIAEEVMKYTGRQLTMDGSLSWTWFPYLGVKTGHLSLKNPPGFQEKVFAEIDHATVGFRLFPLLYKQIESSGIVLDGLTLNLIRQADGRNNWQFQPMSPAAVNKDTAAAASHTGGKMSLGVAISGLDITNAVVHWTDRQKNQSASIEKFAFHAKHINLANSFPVSGEFNFSAQNPSVSGKVAVASQVTLNLAAQVFSFQDLDIAAQLQQGTRKVRVKISEDLTVDLAQQTLQVTRVREELANLVLTGHAEVTHLFTQPHLTSHLDVQPFDLKKFLNEIGEDTTNIQALDRLNGQLDVNANAETVSAQGEFKMDNAEMNHVRLGHIVLPVRYQIGVLELAPVTADFYQGALRANAKVNSTSTVPQIAVEGKLTNIQVSPLVQDVGGASQKFKLTGTGNADWQVTTAGKTGDVILKNLNGNGRASISQGALQGVDIGYLIRSAYSTLTQRGTSGTNTGETPFGTLTGSFVIRDGVVSNDDLLLGSSLFKTNGKGDINLVNRRMDYHLQTFLNSSATGPQSDLSNLYGLPIPIQISGPMNDPRVQLDMGVLARAIAAQQIKQVKAKVQEQLKDKVQGQAKQLLQGLLR